MALSPVNKRRERHVRVFLSFFQTDIRLCGKWIKPPRFILSAQNILRERELAICQRTDVLVPETEPWVVSSSDWLAINIYGSCSVDPVFKSNAVFCRPLLSHMLICRQMVMILVKRLIYWNLHFVFLLLWPEALPPWNCLFWCPSFLSSLGWAT